MHNPTSTVAEELKESKVISFLKTNQKSLLGGLIALVILVGGYFAYKYLYLLPKEEQGSYALYLGQQYFEMGDYEKALKADSKGFLGYPQIAEEYSGTDAGNLANLYAGLCYKHLGKNKEAITYLERFTPKSDIVISPMALCALAMAYEEEGQADKAVSLLKEAAEDADNETVSPYCLRTAGEILFKNNKKEEALKLYQEVKNNYGNTPVGQTIDKYIVSVTAN